MPPAAWLPAAATVGSIPRSFGSRSFDSRPSLQLQRETLDKSPDVDEDPVVVSQLKRIRQSDPASPTHPPAPPGYESWQDIAAVTLGGVPDWMSLHQEPKSWIDAGPPL